MNSAPSAPTPPDPVATSSAQAKANAGTAAAQTALNNVNQVTPYGSDTFSQTGSYSYTNPDGTQSTVPTYTSTQTLSPDQQDLYNEQLYLSNQENDAAGQGLWAVGQSLSNPVTNDNLSPLQTSLGALPGLAMGYDQGGAIQSSVPVQHVATTAAGLDPSSFGAERDAATDAALARLQPTTDRQSAQLDAQLANQGVTAGSSAYNGAQLQLGQNQNDLRLGAVATGDAEQQALHQEALDGANYGLSATAANNAADLAAGQFANSAQAQQNAENASQAAFGNQAKTGLFALGQDAATFGNQAREQQLGDFETLNNNSINQVSALMHGGQVSQSQFQGYTPGQIGQTPISSDTYQSAQLAEQSYQTQAQMDAQNNSAMFSALGGLFSLGTRGGMLGNMISR